MTDIAKIDIVVFRNGGTYDFEDDPRYFGVTSIFEEKMLRISENDYHWLTAQRDAYGWLDWNLQFVLRELFNRD